MNKDWTGNTNSVFKNLSASNHCEEEREENDFYATNPKSVEALLQYETFNNKIYEPCCGRGHISKVLIEHGYNVVSSDLIDRGFGDFFGDFLEMTSKNDRDIITNPPYKYAKEFVEHALDISQYGTKIAMFLKIQFLEGKARKELFKKYPPKIVYVFSERQECAKNGNFIGSSAVCYCWFVWQKGYNSDPIIKWI